MIKCTKCGREFKTPQALGGHMRSAHQDNGAGPENPEELTETAETIMDTDEETALATMELSQAEQIRGYIKQGYTVKQMTEQFGFKETTVRQEISRLVKPEGEALEDKGKQVANVWPVIRKMGGGAEVIAPEAVLRQYMGGTPEGEVELRAIMKFRAAMLMVMDLVNIQKGSAEADAKRMEPILRLMKETREEQDAAAARAKASTQEVAERAAQSTASELFGAISQSNSQVSGSLSQIKQMLGGQSNDPFSQVVSMLQSMQQLSQMFGMPMPGMMPAAGGAPGSQSYTEPPPIEKHSAQEWEEKEEKDV